MPAKSKVRQDAECIINELGYVIPKYAFTDLSKQAHRTKFVYLEFTEEEMAFARNRMREYNPGIDTRVHLTDATHPGAQWGTAFTIFS